MRVITLPDRSLRRRSASKEEADQEAEDLRSISPDAWGEDVDWDVDDVDDDSDDNGDDDAFLYEAINDDRD